MGWSDCIAGNNFTYVIGVSSLGLRRFFFPNGSPPDLLEFTNLMTAERDSLLNYVMAENTPTRKKIL
jgi:hypothetical protein